MNSSYLFLPCSDIDECDSNNGGCDHRCVNEPGSSRCECRTGFDLASNGTTCIGKLSHLFHIIREKCSETAHGCGVAVCLQACSSLGEFEGSCMYNFCFIVPLQTSMSVTLTMVDVLKTVPTTRALSCAAAQVDSS